MTSSFLTHPGVDPHCPICTGRAYQVVRRGEYAHAILCTCVSGCPRCGDTGFVARDDRPGRPLSRCQCTVFQRRLDAFAEVRIPARYYKASFGTFVPTSSAMRALAATLRKRILEDYRPGEENRGFVLYGQVGRGKTHLMIAALLDLVIQRGVTARFVEFSHLLADLKSGFDRGKGAGSLITPLIQCEVLAIDEMGKGRNTEFEGTVLDELISRRYNAAATIIATSNFDPRATSRGHAVPNMAAARPQQTMPSLVDRVGHRVHSRLTEMCDFIPIVGEDYRVLTKNTRRRR